MQATCTAHLQASTIIVTITIIIKVSYLQHNARTTSHTQFVDCSLRIMALNLLVGNANTQVSSIDVRRSKHHSSAYWHKPLEER
jgi:hypothetical protein